MCAPWNWPFSRERNVYTTIGGCERWPKALPAFCEAREGDDTLSDESEYVNKLLF